jgi:hypothetical protein
MSIVTMKRKTAAMIKNDSVGVRNFSLTGTRRNQGYVGQDMRGRTLPKTIMKGNVPRGHGGCCGKYVKGTIVKSITNLNCLNNPSVIKGSVLGTNGMIMTKYRWIRRPQPYSTTKPDVTASQITHTQGQYISNLSKNTLASADNPLCQKFVYKPTKCPRLFKTDENSQISQITGECVRLTKDITNKVSTPKNGVAMESGLYILQLDDKCGVLDNTTYPRKNQGGPLPGN